ncbi:hypothetical protein K450DRAFT_282873 [Umbelopsis ramanniana AG]|uniref:Uncharacterized protein n=1 Tax=Umbelopsis ramanniana AG TaxID=1314678 RepID=A0AAD5HBQ5_UMBRA|nr:uncharacterized protein K450DRAFT_282873 [Umbelopsis ramanniana AG]KAI8577079.1 hypothetical protein K450DRAFT_282873 [Umbelopsis ramanniana AG]
MEERLSSKHRKRRDKVEERFTEPGSSKGKEYRTDTYQYAIKRTPTPSSQHDSYGDGFDIPTGSKVSRTASRNGDVCRNCSRPHSRNDVVPLDKTCYEDGFRNTPIMLPKKTPPKMDSFQNKNPNEFILKKRVRFQLNPSKSTPNFRQKPEKNSHSVSEPKHYGLQKDCQAIHSRNADRISFAYETYTDPLVDKPYLYIHEDDIHSPNNPFDKKQNDSLSTRRYKSMYRDLNNLDLDCQDANDLFCSDTTSDSEKDGEINSKETLIQPRARKEYPTQQQQQQQPRGSRRKEIIEVPHMPSRLPRPVTKTFESARSQSDLDEHQHKPLHSISHKGRTFTNDDTNGIFKGYGPNFHRSNGSSRKFHELNIENNHNRRIWQQRECNRPDGMIHMLSKEIISSESSEDDENFYVQRRQQAKKKIYRERISPDNVTKNVKRYVLDLDRLESSDDDDNMEYREHAFTSQPPNRNFVGTAVRGKKDDRDLSYKNKTTTQRKAYYNAKRWKDEVHIRDDNMENEFRDFPAQSHAYLAKKHKEPDREQARHKTTHIESSGKITRMSKAKQDLEEYEQHDLNQHIEPQREGISNSARIEGHNNLKLTKYDMITLKQTEETHRMFMEVWLPSRASSRTYSRLKRSIWDTPAHLLVLKQTHAEDTE